MKIATLPTKKRKEMIIIGILLIGLPVLIFSLYQVYQLVIRASVEAKPNNVVISNLTTTSATVTWITDVSASGSVIPVLNGSEKSPVLDRRGGSKRYTHYVELTNLEPNTDYEFIIVSDSGKYNSENSKNFTFKTAPITADTPTPNPIHSSVKGGSGDDVILFALTKDKSTYPVSAVMPTGGNWIMDLSALRSVSDKSLVVTSNSTNMVIIAVGGPNKGAVVEGSYSDLFDSSGKLKEVYALNISENTTLYTYFPPVSMLEAYAATTPTKATPSKTTTPVSTPVVKEEEYIFDRRFRIIQQLNWIDMVSGDESVIGGNTGASTIQLVNVTDTGFTVVWVSDKKEQGYIKYGIAKDSLSNQSGDERDGLTTKGTYYVHSVSVSRLQPNTKYFFEVISGENTYDNDGNKYTVDTYSTLNSPPPFDSVSGIVEGMPDHKEVILVAYLEDKDGAGSEGKSLKMSTLVDENGKWILSIADSRNEEGSEYFEYTSGDKFHIDVLSTVSGKTHTENVQGIRDRDIEIVLGAESSSGVGYSRVESLGNYGVLGYSTGDNPDLVSTESTYEISSNTPVPKTGIMDNLYYLITLSSLIVFIAIFLYICTMTKGKRKGKMSKIL